MAGLSGLRKKAGMARRNPEARRALMIEIGIEPDEMSEQEGVGHRAGDMGLDSPDSETQGYAGDEDEELPGRRR